MSRALDPSRRQSAPAAPTIRFSNACLRAQGCVLDAAPDHRAQPQWYVPGAVRSRNLRWTARRHPTVSATADHTTSTPARPRNAIVASQLPLCGACLMYGGLSSMTLGAITFAATVATNDRLCSLPRWR